MNIAGFNQVALFIVVILFVECPVAVTLYYWGKRLKRKIELKKQNSKEEDNEKSLAFLILTVLFIVFIMIFVGIDTYNLILS